MLDDREEAPVAIVEGQLRVGVPWGWNTGGAEQSPGQRLAHLRRVVVHRLEIDPGHFSQPVAAGRRVEDYPPGPLRCAQRAVAAVLEREGRSAEQDAPAA